MIGRIEERKEHQAEVADLERQILQSQQKSQHEKLRVLQLLNIQHLKQKHMDDMAALKEEKESIVDKEMPKLLAEISVLQNELAVNDQRLQNIKKEKYQFEKAQAEFDKIISHIESFQNTVQWKKKRENEEMESLQVRKYQQTIIQATLVDEMD